MTTLTQRRRLTPIKANAASPATTHLEGFGLIGLLFVQIAIGYEWLISGLTR